MDTMKRKIVGIVAVLAVLAVADLLDIGVTEARAQYVGAPVVVPGNYMVRVRPNGMLRVRGRGYGYGYGYGYAAPVVDPMVTVAAYPTTYVTSAPVVTTTRVMTSAPVVTRSYLAPAPVYTQSYLAVPAVPMLRPRVYTTVPGVIGYPY
jgi:hypothetical protein